MEVVQIHTIGDDLERHGPADLSTHKSLVIRAAEHLKLGAFGNAFLKAGEFGHVFPGEQLVFGRASHHRSALALKLKVHAAAIHRERDVWVLFEKVLRHDDVADVHEVVATGFELLADSFGDVWQFPVQQRGRCGVEKPA